MGSLTMTSTEPTKAEFDFEAVNWTTAREAFMSKHKPSETRDDFLRSRTDAQSVKETCLKLQSESETKYHKSIGGILENVDNLMRLGDIAIQSAPQSVGLAWMGIRMCLNAVQGDFATFQLFGAACADIIGIMISCRVYGKMYGHAEGPGDFQELHSKVVEYIPEIYTGILDFSYAVRKYSEKHAVTRFGKNMFKDVKGNFQLMIDDIQANAARMRDYAKVATDRMMVHLQKEGLKNQDAMQADVAFMKEALDTNLKATETFIRHIEALEEERKEMRKKTPYEIAKEEFQENKKLLNPAASQSDLLKDNLEIRREPGTCRWIFELDTYKDWKNTSGSSMLWISGAPGYGKSIVMSTVIESLMSECSDDRKPLVKYFFCRGGDDSTQTTLRILQSVTFWLYASAESSPALLDKTNEIMKMALGKKADQTASQKKQAFVFETVYSGLLTAIDREVFLVLDALDECKDREEKKLLQSLKKVIDMAGSRLKIIVSSRPEADIGDVFQGVTTIKLEGHNEADIRKNVTNEMNKFPRWTSSEKAHACDEIARKAGGQFRYVHIALDFIRKPLVRPYERELAKLPNGLIGSYVSSWKLTDPDYLDLLKTALTWTILADGSITVPEVMDAYSRTYSDDFGVHEDQEDADTAEGNVDLHDSQVRMAGGNFLEVSSSRTISLRHATVREFFLKKGEIHAKSSEKESDSSEKEPASTVIEDKKAQPISHADPVSEWLVSEKDGHLELAAVLVQNLVSSVFQKRYLPIQNKDKHNDDKAVDGKVEEESASKDESVQKPSDEEDVVTSPPTTNGVDSVTENEKPSDSSDLKQEAEELHDHVEVANGSVEDPRKLINGKDNNNPSHESDDTANHDSVDKEAQDETSHTETGDQPAIAEGEAGGKQQSADKDETKDGENEDEKKEGEDKEEAKEEEKDNDEESDDEFSDDEQYLDDPETDDENTDGRQQTQEDKRGRYEVSHWDYHLRKAEQLWSLEEQEANADWAAILGRLKKFMCDDKAAFEAWQSCLVTDPASRLYVNVYGFQFTPLQAAACLGIRSLARLLLKEGHAVDERLTWPKFESQWHESPLELAIDVEEPDLEMARLLMEHKADAFKGHDGPPAFNWAVWQKPTCECVELFLKNGDAEAREKCIKENDYWGWNIMHYFSASGTDPKALKLLLDAGGDINARNSTGATPLHVMMSREDFPAELLEAYLEAGADINIDDDSSQRPLFEIASRKNKQAAELLIQHGADVHDDDKRGLTALHAAAYAGNTDVVKLLLEAGAHPNLEDKKGRTPLYLACQNDYEETATCLLDALKGLAGEEINKPDKQGRTPLRRAAARGHVNIVNVLLEKMEDKTAINTKDSKQGQTTAHVAALNGNLKVLEALSVAGADLMLEDSEGRTPLALCVEGWSVSRSAEHEEAVLYLIARDPSAALKHHALLFTTAINGSAKVLEQLLDAGVDPLTADEHGWTMLNLAQQYQQQAVVELLSSKGRAARYKPTKLVSPAEYLKVSDDGLRAEDTLDYWERTSIPADHPIPAGDQRYYFEADIISGTSQNDYLPVWSVGYICLPARLLSSLPGATGWAWNGDDGWLWHRSGRSIYGGGRFGVGDNIGCAVDFTRKEIRYTRNGVLIDDVAYTDVVGRLYPVIGTAGNCVMRVNFGNDLDKSPWKWVDAKKWIKDGE